MDFVKSYFGKNEPLTTFVPRSTDLAKNGRQKCSTGQRFFLSKYFLKNPYFRPEDCKRKQAKDRPCFVKLKSDPFQLD